MIRIILKGSLYSTVISIHWNYNKYHQHSWYQQFQLGENRQHITPYLHASVDPIGWDWIIWSTVVDVSLTPHQRIAQIILPIMVSRPLSRECRWWKPVGGDCCHHEQGGEDLNQIGLPHLPNMALKYKLWHQGQGKQLPTWARWRRTPGGWAPTSFKYGSVLQSL